MNAKVPNPWRLHPMAPRPTPYKAPCGAILNNAVAALAHWYWHTKCQPGPLYSEGDRP